MRVVFLSFIALLVGTTHAIANDADVTRLLEATAAADVNAARRAADALGGPWLAADKVYRVAGSERAIAVAKLLSPRDRSMQLHFGQVRSLTSSFHKRLDQCREPPQIKALLDTATDSFERALLFGRLTAWHRRARSQAAVVAAASAATACAERIGWQSRLSQFARAAASASRRLHEFPSAIKWTKRRLRAERARDNSLGIAGALNELASLYGRRGQYADALDCLRKSESALESSGLPDHADRRIRILVTRGLICRREGQLGRAQDLFRDAVELTEKAIDAKDRHQRRAKRYYAERVCGLATVHELWGDFTRAEKLYREALSRCQKLDLPGPGVLQAALGVHYMRLQKNKLALDLLERSLPQLPPKHIPAAHVNLAEVLSRLGRHSAAIRVVEKVLGERREDPWFASTTREHLGRILLRASDTTRAEREFKQALALASRYRFNQVVEKAHYGLARAISHRDTSTALDHAQAALDCILVQTRDLSEHDSIEARRQRRELYRTATELALSLGDANRLFSVLESTRARTLIDQSVDRPALDRLPIPESLRVLEKQTRVALNDAASRYTDAMRRGKIAELHSAAEALKRAEAKRSRACHTIRMTARPAVRLVQPSVARLTDVQTVLAADEAVVIYSATTGSEAAALVVTRAKATIVPLGRTDALRKAIRSFRPYSASARNSLKALRKLLCERLPLSDTFRKVYVSPHGVISRAPLGALLAPHDVAIVPSASVLMDKAPAVTGRAILAIGDPATSSHLELAPLPHARGAAKKLGSDALVGNWATESAVRHKLGSSTGWRGVHFGVHGIFIPGRPFQSGLALAPAKGGNGILSGLEILESEIRCKLVVLSACHSGRDTSIAGEGPIGLAWCFHLAGARQVITSLWSIDDEAAATFCGIFYREWRTGVAPMTALRRAQAQFDREGKSPHIWAGWRLWKTSR